MVLNPGIPEHVDAGKASLTDRLPFETGVTDTIGSVDDGSTQTDTDTPNIARQCGITRPAVVLCVIDVTVNLSNTADHPDVIAEVDRVLGMLDTSIVVISAVEGVQAQTQLLRASERLHMPFRILINTVDRSGVQPQWVLDDIGEKLISSIIPMGSGTGAGTRNTSVVPYPPCDGGFRSRLLDLLTDHDDSLLAACLDEETVLEALRHDLPGWQITDCTVTTTYWGYVPRQSHARAVFDKRIVSTARNFRNLTTLVQMAAPRTGTRVYAPLHHFYLDIPEIWLPQACSALIWLRAIPTSQRMRGSSSVLEGQIPVAHVHRLQQQLPALTRGEGVLETTFARYGLVRGATPTRSRTDHNPLQRKEYLLQVMRGV